jgi:hypothetical protein
MARNSKKIAPLFEETKKIEQETSVPVEEIKEEVEQPEAYTSDDTKALERLENEGGNYTEKYKKSKPKMETHIPFNTRIPKTLRDEIDKVAKYYTGNRKNSGFLQEFTENALRAELEKAKQEMEEERQTKKPDQR